MIVTQDNQRLYLTSWEYNACRIITALAAVVENNGGQVKPQRHTAIISNRTLSSAVRDLEEKLQKIQERQEENATEVRAEYIKNKSAELEEMKRTPNNPIVVTHTTYISFVFDGMYYFYSVDTKPFFPFHYIKTPINNGRRSQDAAAENDPKEWFYDCFFGFRVSDADVKEAANLIFNMLVAAKNSAIVRDGRRVRVPNTYNDGYHYEMKYTPERWEKLGEWVK